MRVPLHRHLRPSESGWPLLRGLHFLCTLSMSVTRCRRLSAWLGCCEKEEKATRNSSAVAGGTGCGRVRQPLPLCLLARSRPVPTREVQAETGGNENGAPLLSSALTATLSSSLAVMETWQ